MGEPFIGEIRPFSFNFAPSGWALCNGTIMDINQNQALFALIGAQFGGDGRSTFALPDLRGRTPIHYEPGLYNIGAYGGQEEVTLTVTTMPTHTHKFEASLEAADQFVIDSERLLAVPNEPIYAPPTKIQTMGAQTVSNVGGGNAHDNMQPYQTICYCIATTGAFPSRN